MTGIEIFAWLVLAFADGPDCASSVGPLASRGAGVGARGWVCRPFTTRGEPHRVLVRRSMGRDQNSPRRTVTVLPVGARSGLCEREERDSPIWEHGCQTDTAFAESGPSELAR